MFLISFSENILFSLTAGQRDRKGKGDKREIKEKQLKEREYLKHAFWMCGSVCVYFKANAGWLRMCVCVCIYTCTRLYE